MDKAALKLAGLTSLTGRRAEPAGGGAGRLHGVDWVPVPGALNVVLGAEGAGKSALLRAIAGMDRTLGSITLDGAPPNSHAIGAMLRGDVLAANLTLAENVAAPLRHARLKAESCRRLVAEALDLMDLSGLAELRPDRATPAQRQRALLARAIVAAPRLLLLDEPFAAQDPAARAALIAGVRRVHTLLGATTVLATGESADAMAAADALAILQDGRIVQHGPLEEVFERPGCERTAALLGEINRLPGRVGEIDDDLATVRLDCGPTVQARAGTGLQEGDACVVTLRPDRIAAVAATAAELGADALDAILIEARFVGDSYRLRFLIGTGAAIVAKRPAVAGLRGLIVGQTAALAWQAHQATAFST